MLIHFQTRKPSWVGAVLLLFTGWLFYLFVRGNDPLGLTNLPLSPAGRPWLEMTGSLPTLIHGIALWWLIRSLGAGRLLTLGWFACTGGYELGQWWGVIGGTFDPLDLGVVVSLGALIWHWENCPRPINHNRGINEVDRSGSAAVGLLKGGVLLFGAVTAMATSGYPPIGQTLRLVCMERSALSSSYAVLPPKPIARAGKIYQYQNYLFVSEPYKGIHVFDNTTPSNPVGLGFLNIPGSSDMAVHNDYLYANSAVDLLTIDLTGQEFALRHRNEGALGGITAFLEEGTARRNCSSNQVAVGFEVYQEGDAFEKRIEENQQ